MQQQYLTHPSDVFSCPECHVRIPVTKSVYKHSLGCMNLKHIGVDNLLKEFRGKDDVRSTRIVEAMQEAKRRGE